jgi:hypothetical protein
VRIHHTINPLRRRKATYPLRKLSKGMVPVDVHNHVAALVSELGDEHETGDGLSVLLPGPLDSCHGSIRPLGCAW